MRKSRQNETLYQIHWKMDEEVAFLCCSRRIGGGMSGGCGGRVVVIVVG